MRAFADPRHREDDQIRAERGCVTWAERDPELCGASAPVFGFDGKFVGVLSISAPISRRNREWLESMKPIVLEAAEKITNSLSPEAIRAGNHPGFAGYSSSSPGMPRNGR
jgi:DNA-binding IclR family transcriptional regulator